MSTLVEGGTGKGKTKGEEMDEVLVQPILCITIVHCVAGTH